MMAWVDNVDGLIDADLPDYTPSVCELLEHPVFFTFAVYEPGTTERVGAWGKCPCDHYVGYAPVGEPLRRWRL